MATKQEKLYRLLNIIEAFEDGIKYGVAYHPFDVVVSSKKEALINYDKEEGEIIRLVRTYIRDIVSAGVSTINEVLEKSISKSNNVINKAWDYDIYQKWQEHLASKIQPIEEHFKNKLIVPVTMSYGKGYSKGMNDLGFEPIAEREWLYLPGHAVPRLTALRLSFYVSRSISADMNSIIVEGMREGLNGITIGRKLRALQKTPKIVTVPPKVVDGTITRKGYTYAISNKRYCEMIGRTEANRCTTLGRLQSYKTSELVKNVEHITAGDARVCDTCAALEGMIYTLQEAGSRIPVHVLCFDSKTEVLTDSGWKFFKDLKDNDKIFSLNPETFQPEYVNYRHFVKYHYKGKMFKFKSHILDKCVTPDHKMFVGRRKSSVDRKTRTYELETCKNIKTFLDLSIPSSSSFKGREQEYIKIGNKKIETHLFMRFMGWYISEGNVSLRRKNSYQIGLSQKNPLNIYKDIKDLPYKIDIGKEKLYIFDADLGKYLKKLGKSYEKYIPENLKTLDREYLRSFLITYNKGDGSILKPIGFGTKRGYSYVTSSKRLASDVCELIIKCGKSASMRKADTKGKAHKFRNGTYTINHDTYVIRECTHKDKHLSPAKIDLIDYDDFVYDVELEKYHVLLVKRNQSIYWSGNCRCTMEAHDYYENVTRAEAKENFKLSAVDKVVNSTPPTWSKAPLLKWSAKTRTIGDDIKRYERHLKAHGITSAEGRKKVYAKLTQQLYDTNVTQLDGWSSASIERLYTLHTIKNMRNFTARTVISKEKLQPTAYHLKKTAGKTYNVAADITKSKYRDFAGQSFSEAYRTRIFADASFKKTAKVTNLQKNIVHEIGHSVHYNTSKEFMREWAEEFFKTKAKVKTLRWRPYKVKDEIVGQIPARNLREAGFVSNYATTKHTEDFAESFAAYVLRPKVFKRMCSNKFKLIEKNIAVL